jgi:hypothetical protein
MSTRERPPAKAGGSVFSLAMTAFVTGSVVDGFVDGAQFRVRIDDVVKTRNPRFSPWVSSLATWVGLEPMTSAVTAGTCLDW